MSADNCICSGSGFSCGSSAVFITLPAVSINLEVNVKSATKNGIMFVITRHEYVARATTDLSVSEKYYNSITNFFVVFTSTEQIFDSNIKLLKSNYKACLKHKDTKALTFFKPIIYNSSTQNYLHIYTYCTT